MEPTTTARRSSRKAATRQALLEAGRRFVESRGSEAAQVGDIARAAGVAHGTFYVHFTSKDDLLDELWRDLDTSLARELEPLFAEAERIDEERLRRMIGTCLDHWMAHRGLLGALAERLVREDLQLSLEKLLGELLARSGNVNGEGALMARGLLGMWMRIGMLYALGGEQQPTREQALSALVHATQAVTHASS